MDLNENPSEISMNESEETEALVEIPPEIEVSVSDDGFIGYLRLVKQGEPVAPVTAEQLMEALHQNRVQFGIKEETVEKLAGRPIYNIKIEVARGIPPVTGEDGTNEFLVKKDLEYKPEINEDGIIDFKSLEYFQMAKKNQPLCYITKEKPGTPGTNVFGGEVPAKPGKSPLYPVGDNTFLDEDDTVLKAACDGVVHYVRDVISVRDLLQINGNVDQHTGNVQFPGDVSVSGDVYSGYSLRSGGSVTIRGVIEDTLVEVAGDLTVSKGINGTLKNEILVHGDLKCSYIENAIVVVNGSIYADYIIDSKVLCQGNIELRGSREMILGGDIKARGDITAKDLGSDKERPTRLEILGEKIMNQSLIDKLTSERDHYNQRVLDLSEKIPVLQDAMNRGVNTDQVMEQLMLAKRQLVKLREGLTYIGRQLEEAESKWHMEYAGSVYCKRKLWQGVSIYFGDHRFRFNLDNLEHCRIYFDEGDIHQATL